MARDMQKLVIVGHGAAGLAAALSAAERARSLGLRTDITLLEKAREHEAGGNTRWSPSNIRMDAPDRLAPGFEEDMQRASGGRADRAYFHALATNAVETIGWLKAHGIAFATPIYYLSAGQARIQPVGAGAVIVEKLSHAAKAAGVRTIYEAPAGRLVMSEGRRISGVEFELGEGATAIVEAEAVVLATGGFQGNVVDQDGHRFFDEGGGLVHETWERLARDIHFARPKRIAYAILDSRLFDIEGFERAIRSDVPPLRSETVDGLAAQIGTPAGNLRETIDIFNAAATGDPSRFDAARRDGLATYRITPAKSNWARPIAKPPYLAYPLVGGLAYTFGGLATNEKAEVLAEGGPVAGLYAAGETTGHFYGTAPNAVAVLRALVFGRIAGREAAGFLSKKNR